MATFIPRECLRAAPWKNGGGSTMEIAISPAGAGLREFDWRISLATITASGPFSSFPGIDRSLMLVDGDSVQLTLDGTRKVTLSAAQPMLWFPGEAVVSAQVKGTTTDFNVMTRRGEWTATVQVIHAEQVSPDSPAGLYMVLDDSWKIADDPLLAPGQGLWWSPSQPLPEMLTLTPQEKSAHLVWVSLTPSL